VPESKTNKKMKTVIAKLTGYSRTTVTTALRNNARGLKADKVRKIYLEKYSTVKP